MDQTTFENLILPYTVKIVDKDNPALVKFNLKRNFRYTTVNAKTGKSRAPNKNIGTNKSFKPIKPVITPNGKFNSVREASVHYRVSEATVYSWIAKCKKLGTKEFYYEERTKD